MDDAKVDEDKPEALSVLKLRLPYPPSVNKYWLRVGKRVILSPEARVYKELVAYQIKSQKIPSLGNRRLKLEISVRPPDNRKRDIDNICKCILDALQDGGVFDDDSQVDTLHVQRCGVQKGGSVEIAIFYV